MSRPNHREGHRNTRIGWLRAAVLGANDGIVSTASLLVGVASAHASHATLLTTGVAGLVAGAMSMAAGEYVSVGSQADTENADLAMERAELASQPEHEMQELTSIYVERGLTPELAREVAVQLMAKDALGAHARDELGITEALTARPVQAALTSAATFAIGAALPLVTTLVTPSTWLVPVLIVGALVFLVSLGMVGARIGGAPMLRAALRVGVMGALAMALTAGAGALFGASG
jgi:VIT1/CCC1 family predicted Fe2+/Mn2+ transporter